MCHIHLSEMERMQRLAQDNARRIIEETEKLKYELECKRMKLDKWSQQLTEQEALTISERQKLEEEKKRVNILQSYKKTLYNTLGNHEGCHSPTHAIL